MLSGVKPTDAQSAIAKSLKGGEQAHILLGNIARSHAAYSAVRALAVAIADATGATIGEISEGSNSAGLAKAGVLPHRDINAAQRATPGLNAHDMLSGALETLLLVNVEPDADMPHATIGQHKFIAAVTAFVSETLDSEADLLLPAGTWAESAGTFVNAEGRSQSFSGFATPVGESRPVWKILRVLGNLIGAEGFDYVSVEDIAAEIDSELKDAPAGSPAMPKSALKKPNGEDKTDAVIDLPIYSVDGVVRRARALQLTDSARRARGEEVDA
jgi:NADH-quinone oxidoreductase subunit G